MEEREAQAAEPCGSDGLAPFWRLAIRAKERWLCFKRATQLRSSDRGCAVTRQYSDRPVADQLRLAGHWESKAQCFKLESLILAQNERWRQA